MDGIPLVASPQPDGLDCLDLGEFLSMVLPDGVGEPGEAEGCDCCVWLGKEQCCKIAETGDSWESYALTGHVRF